MTYPNIWVELLKQQMTNRMLAEKLGVSEKTINNWKNGRTEIPASKLVAMSRLFNCTTDYLLGIDNGCNKRTSYRSGNASDSNLLTTRELVRIVAIWFIAGISFGVAACTILFRFGFFD